MRADRVWPAVAAVALGARALVGVLWGQTLEPDTSLYLGEGSYAWFYPSPLGRVAGLGGFGVLAALNVAAAAALGWLVVRLAQSRAAGPGGWAPLVGLVAFPALWYVQPVGVDAAGAALVCGAVLRGGWSLGLASLLLHPASGLGWLGWRGWRGGYAAVLTVAFVASCAVGAAMMTPYAGIVTRMSIGGGLPAAGTALAVLVPGVVLWRVGFAFAPGRARAAGLWSLVLAVAVVFAQGGVQVRYLLPASCLLAASLVWRADA